MGYGKSGLITGVFSNDIITFESGLTWSASFLYVTKTKNTPSFVFDGVLGLGI